MYLNYCWYLFPFSPIPSEYIRKMSKIMARSPISSRAHWSKYIFKVASKDLPGFWEALWVARKYSVASEFLKPHYSCRKKNWVFHDDFQCYFFWMSNNYKHENRYKCDSKITLNPFCHVYIFVMHEVYCKTFSAVNLTLQLEITPPEFISIWKLFFGEKHT